ncbi:MAG: putative C-14 sterol reductase Erg24, partial [Streblomastix strix]
LKNLKYFDPEAICFYAAWFSSLVLLWKIIPGKKVFGSPLNDMGDKLEYKMNGFYTFLIVMAGVFAAIFIKGPSIMLFFFDHFFGIQLTSYIFAVILCTYLYISSFSGEKHLAKGTQNVHIYDYWMGRELNPRIGKFDWKQFCELRPGMREYIKSKW